MGDNITPIRLDRLAQPRLRDSAAYTHGHYPGDIQAAAVVLGFLTIFAVFFGVAAIKSCADPNLHLPNSGAEWGWLNPVVGMELWGHWRTRCRKIGPNRSLNELAESSMIPPIFNIDVAGRILSSSPQFYG